MTHPISRSFAASAFANLSGRRKAKAVEEDDEAKKAEGEDEEAKAADDTEESESEGDEKEAKAMDEDEEAEGDEDEKEAKASADFKRGAQSERKRISSILNSDEAHGKGASALHLALNTSLSASDARQALAGIEAGHKSSRLDAAMQGTETRVGADSGRQEQSINDVWTKAHGSVSKRLKAKS